MNPTEIAAILALRVYDEQPIISGNLPLEPEGWVKLNNPLTVTDGFAYGVFRNTATNEVVISYRGTAANRGSGLAKSHLMPQPHHGKAFTH